MKKINLTANKKENEHFFFGYYDLQPYSPDNALHLAHKVRFADRVPQKGDVAEIGYIDTRSCVFTPIAETKAWNFQQGALTQWFDDGKTVVFNDFDGEKYVSRVVDRSGNEVRRYGMPFACLNRKAGKAMSINFSRVYDFRKGYGYCNAPDAYANDIAPKSDGIFSLDLITGEHKLILSYAQMREAFCELPYTDSKLVVNHITFNPSGTKFVFLLRNFPEEGKKWGTVLAVGDTDGNVKKLTNFEVNSHYSWRDDDNLMIYAGLPSWGIYFINTESGERKRLYDPLCDRDDIHCNYSPDRKCFIGDGYPQKDGVRSLYKYDFATKRSCELLRVFSLRVADADIRCDLHARFSADGSRISYDTTENRTRDIMQLLLE